MDALIDRDDNSGSEFWSPMGFAPDDGCGFMSTFHPWVYPNPTWVFSGAGSRFKSHPRVTRQALEISLI
jgi:hypothetical protein